MVWCKQGGLPASCSPALPGGLLALPLPLSCPSVAETAIRCSCPSHQRTLAFDAHNNVQPPATSGVALSGLEF